MKIMRGWVLGALWVVAGHLAAMPQVKVEGLFKGAAVFNINGQQVMLRQGQRHASGVRLLEANSRRAVVEVNNQRHEMTLHRAIGGRYQQASLKQFSIKKNDRNQYRVAGSINGLPVTFLVDTGANTVALNSRLAKKLGIQYRLDGEEGRSVTASGTVRSWGILLDSVKVGEIEVKNVRAGVVDGDYPVDALLGMSFLENVKISEHNNVMLLEKRF